MVEVPILKSAGGGRGRKSTSGIFKREKNEGEQAPDGGWIRRARAYSQKPKRRQSLGGAEKTGYRTVRKAQMKRLSSQLNLLQKDNSVFGAWGAVATKRARVN